MRRKVELPPPPTLLDSGLPYQWNTWIDILFERIGEGPFLIRGYSKSSMPPASSWGDSGPNNMFSSIIFVPDATGGATLAYSNGSSWLSVQDGLIIS